MTNVEYKIEGNHLHITVDLTKRHGRSKSGQTITIATTSGNQKLDGKFAHVSFGLNVYTKDGLGTVAPSKAA